MSYFRNVLTGKYILWNLVKQDLKSKYRNSILGVGWTLLTPLSLVTIIGSVYSILLGQPIKYFVPFLFSGLIPWLYVVGCAEGGSVAFLSAQGYIKQTQAPIEIFPIRKALVAFINLLFSLIAFFIILIILKPYKLSFSMLAVIPALIIWILFGIAWSTIAGIVNLYFRDFAPLQSLLLQGLFYVTPIIFPPQLLKEKHFEWVYLANPLYYMMEIFRRPLLGEIAPPIKIWAVASVFSLFLFAISILILTKIGRKIAFKL